METKFIYDKKIEAQRLLSVYLSLTRNIYSDNGFMVLPYRVPRHPRAVYLPQMDGVNVLEIVDKIAKYERINVPTNIFELQEISQKIEPFLKLDDEIDKDHTVEIEKVWKLQEKVFEDYFLSLFPQFRKNKLKLNIYWTRFGSLVSYSRPLSKGVLNEATIFLRDDMDVGQIVEGALSSFLASEFDKREMSWMQYETVVDFLGLDTFFKHISKNFYPTLLKGKAIEKFEEGKLFSDSLDYLKRMGLDRDEMISFKNNMLYIYGKPSKSPFGKTEIKFLENLIKAPMNPISYYDLGDLIWKDDPDDFSLWALSQLAYKVRNKLRKDGIDPNIIRNTRGIGYVYMPQA